MTSYIRAVKCALRDQHGFKPNGGTDTDPTFSDEAAIPDGEYRCEIDGKTDYVRIKNSAISCCNPSAANDAGQATPPSGHPSEIDG